MAKWCKECHTCQLGGKPNQHIPQAPLHPIPALVTLNNKLGLENPTHSESCVGLEAEKEEDTESEVRLENDQQPIKLQKSQ